MSYGGEAVGRLPDGRVVFVPYGAPGDVVDVRLISEKKKFARGEIVAIEERSPLRVDAPCPYFGECGGCQFQHVGYAAQLEAKEGIVRHALRCEVEPIIGSEAEYGYRSRARMAVEGETLGYHAWRTDRVMDIRKCLLLEPPLDAAIQAARPRLPRGGELLGQMGRDGAVALRCGNFREGPEEVNLAEPGEPPFYCRAGDFAQASAAGNRALRELVRVAAEAADRRVLELFAGAGNFTRDLAAIAREVVAVEGSAGVAPLFARNVRVPARLITAPVEREVAAMADEGECFDVVVLDPPREGAAAACRALPRLRPDRIVYVSCDPMTLARDVRELEREGYRAVRVQPLDLMPQTYHIEVVATLLLQPEPSA